MRLRAILGKVTKYSHGGIKTIEEAEHKVGLCTNAFTLECPAFPDVKMEFIRFDGKFRRVCG